MYPQRHFSDARLRKIGFSVAAISLIAEYNAYLVYKGTHPYWSSSKEKVNETSRRTPQFTTQFTTLNGVPIPHFVDVKKE